MRQVERHIIKESNQYWKEIDRLCFLSKNLYNYAYYLVRQSFIFYNIMRKVIPTVFNLGIEGAVVRPIRVTPNRAKG